MAASLGSLVTSWMKIRSIFRVLIGKRFRWFSEEYPVPKSSMARLMPRLGEPLHRPDGLLNVVHDRRLRELQLQLPGIEFELLEDAGHPLDEVSLTELAPGDVDVHPKGIIDLLSPGASLGAGAAQHPFANRYDQALSPPPGE